MEIYISNLKKSYGQNVIFNGISLSISDNSVTCLFGSSGSGKTTLINIIGQIEEYDSGKIVYDNKEITGECPHHSSERGKIPSEIKGTQ